MTPKMRAALKELADYESVLIGEDEPPLCHSNTLRALIARGFAEIRGPWGHRSLWVTSAGRAALNGDIAITPP